MKKAILTGHVRINPFLLEEVINDSPSCQHLIYCTSNNKPCDSEKVKICQLNRFYLRYGEDYNQIGI